MIDVGALRADYLAAQLRGDTDGAVRLVLESIDRGLSVRALSEDVIREAQREIGEKWQRNEVGIADEHMATAISHLVLARVAAHTARVARNGKSILVACVEGELHELPARLVADALDADGGFSVRYLGASVPTVSLLEMIEKHRPDLVALSVTMSFHVEQLRDAVRRIRAKHPQVPIAIGGNACRWGNGVSEELAADITAKGAAEMVELARRRLGVHG